MNEGWISLHRKITEHWIWSDPVKLKWWLDLLLYVNHSDQKVLIGNILLECKKGQSIMSLQNWANRWGVSKDTIRSFFDLLKKERMIQTENLKKTTRITICNYGDYQCLTHDDPTNNQTTNQPHTHPNNNDNKDNNIEEDVIKGWRDDFRIYLSEATDAYEGIVKDIDFIKDRERYHPNIDIKLSLEKSFKDYWSTEAAWYKRKKSRTKKLDWVSTFKNSLDQKMNQVYKSRQDLFSQQPTLTKEKLCQWEIPKLGDKRKGSYEQYEADVKRNAPLQVNFLGYVE